MTHEHYANAEDDSGPEHDHSLPSAESVPVFSDPADSDGPPIPELTTHEATVSLEDARENPGAAYGADPAGWPEES